MKILVTNDDGIFSPGLEALAEAAKEFGEVLVMAPDVEQSAMGHAITIRRPLRYHRTNLADFDAYRVNGTPADCVALGMYHWGGADFIASGINLGSNLGNDIWHSGTVAAAKQGVLLGARAAAFSLTLNGSVPDFEPLKDSLKQVFQLLITQDEASLVNVNFPQEPTELLWTHQSVRSYRGKVVEGEDPMGRKHYWFAAVPLSEPEEQSDRWAVDHGLVSLTPLALDLTDESALATRRNQSGASE